jgi:purine-nucleoside phosphorylase
VLGSGLGAFADSLEGAVTVPYSEIPNLPRPTVIGHPGRLSFGRIGTTDVACLSGRVHLYEGHAPGAVVFGVRLLAGLGCHTVLLTNAAGGIRKDLFPGDLMLVTDHVNLTGTNPLTGPEYAFVDMTRAYDPDVARAARTAAAEVGVALREGVYAGLAGPSYETPAEIRMLATFGADAVGMSTVMETIALRRLGIRVGAVSCITNMAAGLASALLDHREVEEVARKTRAPFESLVGRWAVLCSREA